MTPADRVLDLALREVLGDERPPDLTSRIHDAIARRNGVGRTKPILLAAAAVLVAAVGLFFWRADEPDPPAVEPTPVSEDPPDPPPVKPELPPEEKQVFDDLMKMTLVDVDKSDPKRVKEAEMQLVQLRAMLRARPAAWDHVRARLLDLATARAAKLALLVHDPDPATRAVLEQALAQTPREFADGPLTLLAERDLPGAEAELARRLAGAPNYGQIWAALYFGVRGDARAEKALRWMTGPSRMGATQPDLYVAAAACLHRLGDEVAWSRAVGLVRRRMNTALAGKDLATARRRVAALAYFHRVAFGREPVAVAFLGEQLAGEESRLETEADVRARLVSLGG